MGSSEWPETDPHQANPDNSARDLCDSFIPKARLVAARVKARPGTVVPPVKGQRTDTRAEKARGGSEETRARTERFRRRKAEGDSRYPLAEEKLDEREQTVWYDGSEFNRKQPHDINRGISKTLPRACPIRVHIACLIKKLRDQKAKKAPLATQVQNLAEMVERMEAALANAERSTTTFLSKRLILQSSSRRRLRKPQNNTRNLTKSEGVRRRLRVASKSRRRKTRRRIPCLRLGGLR